MKNKHVESFRDFNENLNISGVINRLSNWNTDRVRKKERLKIYNQYKSGDISYDEYVKQRKELEERYKEEDK
jgi:hypothetical protein